jgi:hypothetical protein
MPFLDMLANCKPNSMPNIGNERLGRSGPPNGRRLETKKKKATCKKEAGRAES